MAQTMQNLESSSRSNESFNAALAAMQEAERAYREACKQAAKQMIPIGSLLTLESWHGRLFLVTRVENYGFSFKVTVQELMFPEQYLSGSIAFTSLTSSLDVMVEHLQRGKVRVFTSSDEVGEALDTEQKKLYDYFKIFASYIKNW